MSSRRAWPGACRQCLLAILAGLLALGAAWAQSTPTYRFREAPSQALASLGPGVLTDEERAFLRTLPEVRVALALPGFRPYEVISPDGEITGIHPEMLVALARAFGIRLRPVVFQKWGEVVEASRQGQVDLLMSVGVTAARAQTMAFTLGATPMVSALFTRRAGDALGPAPEPERARFALERGNMANDFVKRQYPQAQVVPVDDAGQALRAVVLGGADYYVGNLLPTMDRLARDPLPGVEVANLVSYGSGYYHYAVRKDWALLATILNKGLSALRQQMPPQLQMVLDSLPSHMALPSLKPLSAPQQALLNERPIWRVGAVRGLRLLNDVDAEGKHSGIAAEYVEAVARQLGVGLQVQAFDNVAAMLDALRAGEIDLVPFLTATPEREQHFRFSQPYVEMPYMIVARNDAPMYWSLASLNGRRLALAQQHPLRELVAKKYPGIQVVEVANGNAAMDAVVDGRADAAVEVKLFANLRIQGDNDGRLRSVAEVEELPAAFRFATALGGAAERLIPLINDTLADVPEAERQRMLRRWVAIDATPTFNWRRYRGPLAAGAAGALLLAAVTAWWMRRLQREVRARRASEQQLQDIGHTLPCLAFRTEFAPDGTLRQAYYSAGAHSVLGFAPDPARTLVDNLGERLVPSGQVPLKERIRNAQRTLQPIKANGRYLHPDGSTRWLHSEAVPKRTADGGVSLTGYVADVTNELELQAQLTREAEARHLLLASASHELRAPTHTLSLALQALAGNTGAAQEHLQVARDATRTLTQLIDDVLDTARLNHGELRLRPQAFGLRELLQDVAAATRPWAAERGLRFEFRPGAGLPDTVTLDPLRLRQVLTNLLSNALKYTREGEVLLQADGQGHGLHFVIQDTGVGIEPERLERLFTPFVAAQADAGEAAQRASTGLGLGIAKKLVDMMGGQLQIASTPGQGTVVRLSIPLPVRAASAPERAVVLLCDDDETSRLLLAHMLRSHGLDVAEAGDGAQALQRWRQGDVGTVITDLAMAGMSGGALIQQIRQEEAGQPQRTCIVVCSGEVPQAVGDAQRPAWDAFLSKPASMKVLLDTLAGLGVPGVAGVERQPA